MGDIFRLVSLDMGLYTKERNRGSGGQVLDFDIAAGEARRFCFAGGFAILLVG